MNSHSAQSRKNLRVAWRDRIAIRLLPERRRIEVVTRNVSVHGILAFCEETLPPGAEVEVDVASFVGLSGRVARSNIDGTMAITFEELDSVVIRKLRQEVVGRAMKLMEHIAEFPAFSGLTELEQMTLTTVCHEVHLEAGELLARLGDEATSVFLVKSGCVKILAPNDEDDAKPLEMAYAGQVFGEVSALLGLPHNLDIRAEDDTELLAIPRESLVHLRENNPTLSLTLYEIFTAFMGRRLRRMTARLFSPMSC